MRTPLTVALLAPVMAAAAEYLLEQFGNRAVLGAAQDLFLPNQLSQVEYAEPTHGHPNL